MEDRTVKENVSQLFDIAKDSFPSCVENILIIAIYDGQVSMASDIPPEQQSNVLERIGRGLNSQQEEIDQCANLAPLRFIRSLTESLPPEVKKIFGMQEIIDLTTAMRECNMKTYPPKKTEFEIDGGTHCVICGKPAVAHPIDWREAKPGTYPSRRIVCDGQLVNIL